MVVAVAVVPTHRIAGATVVTSTIVGPIVMAPIAIVVAVVVSTRSQANSAQGGCANQGHPLHRDASFTVVPSTWQRSNKRLSFFRRFPSLDPAPGLGSPGARRLPPA